MKKWFYGKPKKNGLYWIRRKNNKDTIVSIWDIDTDMPMVAFIGSDRDQELNDFARGVEFSGPIEPPGSYNPWEKACKEFLKGCSCSDLDRQEACMECLKTFCDHLRNLAKQEGYKKVNEHVIPPIEF